MDYMNVNMEVGKVEEAVGCISSIPNEGFDIFNWIVVHVKNQTHSLEVALYPVQLLDIGND